MESPGEVLQLCRLCLANNQVNVPIFGEISDIRQISLKISSCLPVKIAADDLLPKNICEGCSDKLELVYAFWNSSQEAENSLRAWIQQIDINNASETISAVAKQIANSEVIAATAEVKKEIEDDRDKITINQSFDEVDEDVYEKVTEEAPPPKRARHSPAVKEEISISQEFDDDEYVDEAEPYLTNVEDESYMSDSEEDKPLLSFVDFPDTSIDGQQAGPSGVNEPFNLYVKEEIGIIEDDLLEKAKREEERNAVTEQIGKEKTIKRMPRVAKNNKLYTHETLQDALIAIENGMSYGVASRTFNIPKTTLIYKKSGKIPLEAKSGPPTLLSSEEEETLVKWLLHISEKGFPATRTQLADSIELLFKHSKKENPFPNGRPSRKWHQLFEKRHPQVTTRFAQNSSKPRSDITEMNISSWHAEVLSCIQTNNLQDIIEDPKQIYHKL